MSPLSPVPGQFAVLCARLHLTGHGITTPPARDLPEPWLSMLAHDRRGQARTVPAALPELDEITLVIRACTPARAAPSCTSTPAAR